MHVPALESPHVTNSDGSWTFTFLGTLFGADPKKASTVVSIVTVTRDGDVRVDRNGPIPEPPSGPDRWELGQKMRRQQV